MAVPYGYKFCRSPLFVGILLLAAVTPESGGATSFVGVALPFNTSSGVATTLVQGVGAFSEAAMLDLPEDQEGGFAQTSLTIVEMTAIERAYGLASGRTEDQLAEAIVRRVERLCPPHARGASTLALRGKFTLASVLPIASRRDSNT